MDQTRVLLVSNRLPVSIKHGPDGSRLVPSSGGLATALQGVHREGEGRWIGWPGVFRDDDGGDGGVRDQMVEARLQPVELSQADVELYYDGYSNAVLWPLFHYLLDKVKLDAAAEWEAYQRVNRMFAEVVAQHLRPDDTVWIHDYHLMLLPRYLRRIAPDARIGFFLHVPWPASDVFSILPAREEILEGVLGADLIGFHTENYRVNFVRSAAQLLAVDAETDSLRIGDHLAHVGVYPIGIDVAAFERASPRVEERLLDLREQTHGKKVLLGVDRLDYTKGVPRRLLAFDRLLEREPALRDKVHYVQLAVPTRNRLDAYADLRRRVNEMVGRISARYGTAAASPIQLLYRSVDADELLALYRAADVMLVTPLRDGMNVVAKEYVAARTDEDGVLMLSEFAGASSDLHAAVSVNPYNVEAMAEAMRQALEMDEAERRLRMRGLRAAVRAAPVDGWAQTFLRDLAAVDPAPKPKPSSQQAIQCVVRRMRGASHRALVIEYDGALVPLHQLSELARPDQELVQILRRLSALPATDVHVLSGRTRGQLEAWFGDLPISLHAEHGFWSRELDGSWYQAQGLPGEVLSQAAALIRRHAARMPGAFLEQKSASLAYHYRRVDAQVVEPRLRSLRDALRRELGSEVDVREGQKALEVRPKGISKGAVVTRLMTQLPSTALVFVAGYDGTAEDLFEALRPGMISALVGPGPSLASLRLVDYRELRRLLLEVAAEGLPEDARPWAQAI